MSDQGAGSGVDSTMASGRTRTQTDAEAAQAETTTEVRNPPTQPGPVGSNFASSKASEQDPRSSAGPASGTRSPPAASTPPPSMSYQASQLPAPAAQRLSSAQDTLAQGQLQQDTHMQEEIQQHHKLLQQQQRHQRQLQQVQHRFQQQQQQEQRQRQSRQSQQSHSQNDHCQRHRSSRQHRREHHQDQDQTQTPHKIEPPVTKATLSELDVGKIIHNPKLRHDINYDPELHFRPNLDGEKGRRKQEKAQQFWDTLRDDLIQFVVNRDEFLKTHEPEDWSLPSLLNAVKDIIQTLVPARDRELLNEGLNVPLLMQQFNRGVVDLEKLASWLSSVLKLHCAPMRDDWVDEMYRELSRGNQENDMNELVKGMCSLLSVLEAMKLDVANHQIRCLRPLLIEDTVHFEQRFFSKKIDHRRMSVESAFNWYQGAKRDFTNTNVRHKQAFGEMDVFFHGLAKLLLPCVDVAQIPNTFIFDEDRIVKLRSDMFDAIHLEICMKVYEMAEAEEIAASSGPSYPSQTASLSTLAVPSYVERQSHFDFNTPPLSAVSGSPASSRPSSLNLSACGSTSSSPRNSSSQMDLGATPPRQPADFAEARARTQSLYSCLVALLQTAAQTARPTQRWEDLWPKMAVEIYRTLNTADRQKHMSLDDVEKRLEAALRPFSPIQAEVETNFQDRLVAALARRVKDFKTMPCVGLFVVAAGGRIHPAPARAPEATTAAATAAAAAAAAAAALMSRNTRVVDPREDGGIEDMATRLAHLGVIHWRVWGQMAYEPQPAEDDEEMSS